MADTLRPRLDRLEILSKQLNFASDEIARAVQNIEGHLNDELHIGTMASVVLEHDEDHTGTFVSERRLVYGRYGPKFRFYVDFASAIDGQRDSHEQMLWANCPRDVKLLAFQRLPELLDELITRIEGVLQQVDATYDAVKTLVPVRGKGAKA